MGEKVKKKLRHGLNSAPPVADDEPNGLDVPIEADESAAGREALQPYLKECVKVDPLDINSEFMRIAADLAFWNAQYAKALERFLTAKARDKFDRARLEPLVRQAIINAGAKPTEKQVDAQIEQRDDVQANIRELISAEVEKNYMFGCLDAIRAKKEMLVSLGAQMRAEMQGDPRISEQARHAHRDDG